MKEKKQSVLLFLLIVVVGLLVWQMRDGTTIERAPLREARSVTTPLPREKETATAKKSEKAKEKKMVEPVGHFVSINKDVIGYISIPDTEIEYPVLMGTDNTYYLTHDLYGKADKSGTIMADYKYQNTGIEEMFLRHTMLYGHHLARKGMFTTLVQYKKADFFQKHPYIEFSNRYKKGRWKVFSVYVVNADEETIPRMFEKDEEYLAFLEKAKSRSKYAVDVSFDKDSKVLTLCTCSYETDNSRTIVHAILEEE